VDDGAEEGEEEEEKEDDDEEDEGEADALVKFARPGPLVPPAARRCRGHAISSVSIAFIPEHPTRYDDGCSAPAPQAAWVILVKLARSSPLVCPAAVALGKFARPGPLVPPAARRCRGHAISSVSIASSPEHPTRYDDDCSAPAPQAAWAILVRLARSCPGPLPYPAAGRRGGNAQVVFVSCTRCAGCSASGPGQWHARLISSAPWGARPRDAKA